MGGSSLATSTTCVAAGSGLASETGASGSASTTRASDSENLGGLAKNVGLLEKIREEEDKLWVVFEKDPELDLERQSDLERIGFWLLEILH